MPRIPEAAFNTTPSTRVGRVPTPSISNSAATKLTKTVQNVMGVQAKLQDQNDRADAYRKVNGVKNQYNVLKLQAKTAMNNLTDSDGNYSYIDPSDDNPEIAKRRRVEGNVNEIYGQMREVYDKGVNEVGELNRADLAGIMLEESVGDDLLKTRIGLNQTLLNKKSSEVTSGYIENVELRLEGLAQSVEEGRNTGMLAMDVQSISNSLDRELAQISPIIGDGVEKAQRYKDNMLGKYAGQMVARGASQSSIETADLLIQKIKDPIVKSKAQRDLARTKKHTVQFDNFKKLSMGADTSRKIADAPFMHDQVYQQAMDQAFQIQNMYIDENSTISRQEAIDASISLTATTVSKKYLQDNIEENLEFLVAPTEQGEGRAPSAAADNLQKEEALVDEVEEMMKAQGTGLELLQPENREKTRATIKSHIKTMYSNMRNNLAETVAMKYKLSGKELNDKITQVAETQGFGDVPLVPESTAKSFMKEYTKTLGIDADMAFSMIEDQKNQAGSEYTRATIVDIIGRSGNKNSDYLIAAADMDSAGAYQIISDASRAKKKEEEMSGVMSKVRTAWKNLNYEAMDGMEDSPLYRGMRSAIWNAAIANAEDEDGIQDAMKEAFESYQSRFTNLTTDDGRSYLMLTNPTKGNGLDFSDRAVKQAMSFGVRGAKSLKNLPTKTRQKILKDYLQHPNADVIVGKDLDMILGSAMRVVPSKRWKNKSVVMYNDVPVLDENGKVIEVDAETIYGIGKELVDKRNQEQQSVRTQFFQGAR